MRSIQENIMVNFDIIEPNHLQRLLTDESYAAHYIFKDWVIRRYGLNEVVGEYGFLGYGRHLKYNPLTSDETLELIMHGIASEGGITKAYALYLLNNDASRAEKSVRKAIGDNTFEALNYQRRAVLMDIVWDAKFKVRKLRKLLDAVKQFDWEVAVAELWQASEACFNNYIDAKAEVLRTGLIGKVDKDPESLLDEAVETEVDLQKPLPRSRYRSFA